jgi:CBS domain-containing protein
LAEGVEDSATVARLEQAGAACGAPAAEIAAWTGAYRFLQTLRLRNQHAQRSRGEPVSDLVQPSMLNSLDRKVLAESLREADRLRKRVQARYGAPT